MIMGFGDAIGALHAGAFEYFGLTCMPRAGLPILGSVAVAAGTASLTASHSARFSVVQEWDILLLLRHQLSVQDKRELRY